MSQLVAQAGFCFIVFDGVFFDLLRYISSWVVTGPRTPLQFFASLMGGVGNFNWTFTFGATSYNLTITPTDASSNIVQIPITGKLTKCCFVMVMNNSWWIGAVVQWIGGLI